MLGTILLLAITSKPVSAIDCTPEPASQWAPAGYICPPQFGVGWASTYDGDGIAVNWCQWPFNCAPVRITALATGLSIVRTPVTWCMCWVGVTGPNGETERIVDLDPATVAALGLDLRQGLWRVRISPATGSSLPDTALARDDQ